MHVVFDFHHFPGIYFKPKKKGAGKKVSQVSTPLCELAWTPHWNLTLHSPLLLCSLWTAWRTDGSNPKEGNSGRLSLYQLPLIISSTRPKPDTPDIHSAHVQLDFPPNQDAHRRPPLTSAPAIPTLHLHLRTTSTGKRAHDLLLGDTFGSSSDVAASSWSSVSLCVAQPTLTNTRPASSSPAPSRSLTALRYSGDMGRRWACRQQCV